MSPIKQILNLFFPETCVICKKSSVTVCSDCLNSLVTYSQNNPNLPKFISPVFSYKDQNVKKIIWAFKYSNKKHLAPILAQALQDNVQATVSDLYELKGVRNVLLLPIPLHIKRYREREYNQSELLVREIIKSPTGSLLKAEYNLLVRNKMSPPNAKSHSRRERAMNTTGSFNVIDKSKIAGQYIVLVDDVVTTGTTLSEARKVLLAAGAREIFAITLAH
jgi:ComF family protein